VLKKSGNVQITKQDLFFPFKISALLALIQQSHMQAVTTRHALTESIAITEASDFIQINVFFAVS